MSSDGTHYTYIEAFLRTSGWTVFLAMGIALALVAIQNHYLKRPLLPPDQLILVSIGAVVAGIVAGLVGQLAHTVFDLVSFGAIGRILAWTVLGTLLARGMVFFMPNLNTAKALQFGALGGFLGVVGYYIMTGIMGDVGGRLAGAFILGACIGLLVVIVETVYRNVWLMVLHDPRDFTQVNLGPKEVTIGSGKEDTVVIAGVSPGAGKFRVDGKTIRYTDVTGTQTLRPGSRIHLGRAELVVCSKETPFSPSKFYPMKMKKAMEMRRDEGNVQ